MAASAPEPARRRRRGMQGKSTAYCHANMRGKQQDPHLPRFAFLPNDTPSYGGSSSSACTTNSPQAAGTAAGAAVIAAASTAQTKRQGCARASMQMAMFGTHYTATEDNGARCRVRIRERNEYLFLMACTLSCQGAGSCPDPPTLHHPPPRFCTDIAAPADCALKWCPDCAPVSLARCNCTQRWAPQAHLSWQAAHGTAAREDGGHGSEILVLMHAAWAQPSASGCCSVQPRWPWGGAHQKQQEHSRRTCTSAAAGEATGAPTLPRRVFSFCRPSNTSAALKPSVLLMIDRMTWWRASRQAGQAGLVRGNALGREGRQEW